MPTTEKKRAAARANGAKSPGPKTAEGKARSRMNALKHGFCATDAILLPGESSAEFHLFQQAYFETYQPATLPEYGFVQEIIVAAWKLRRAWTMEQNSMIVRLDDQREAFNKEFVEGAPSLRLTLAMKEELQEFGGLIHRYQVAQELAQRRALQKLIQHRRLFPLAPPAPQPISRNEPTEDLTPVESTHESTPPTPIDRPEPAAARYRPPATWSVYGLPTSAPPEPAPTEVKVRYAAA